MIGGGRVSIQNSQKHQERDVSEQLSIYERHPRESDYTFVTCPDFPGFSFMLEPEQDDSEMNAAFVQFLAYDIKAAKTLLRS